MSTMGIKEVYQQQADLRNERQELAAENTELLATSEAEGMNEEQSARWKEISARRNAIDRRLDQLDEVKAALDIDRQIELEQKSMTEGNVDPNANGITGLPAPVVTPKLFGSFGEQMKAIHQAAVGGYTDPRLLELNAAAQGAGEAIGADGGFLVQQDFSTEILRKMHDVGQVINRVQRVPVSGNGLVIPYINETSRVAGSRWGAIRGYWVDEGTDITASRPKLGRISLLLKKVAALGYATDELLEDFGAMSTIFTQGFAEELLWLVEDSVFNGTGSGMPAGILQSAATVRVAKKTGQTAATVIFENISKMWARCWARSRANAVWFINQDVEPQLDELSLSVGTGGGPVYMPAGGLADTPFGRLKGRPVIPVEYCATLGTVGDIVLADLSQYMFIDKGGVQQASSMHVAFTTDEMAFRATYRVDGQSTWNSALTPVNGTNTLSPFVSLATRG